MADGTSQAKARLAYQLVQDRALYQIFNQPMEDETPGSRLRQFGMVIVLIDLHIRGQAGTVTKIVDVTGMTRGAVEEVLRPLGERGLVKSTWIKNSIGRGKARLFFIAQSAFPRDVSLAQNGMNGTDSCR